MQGNDSDNVRKFIQDNPELLRGEVSLFNIENLNDDAIVDMNHNIKNGHFAVQSGDGWHFGPTGHGQGGLSINLGAFSDTSIDRNIFIAYSPDGDVAPELDEDELVEIIPDGEADADFADSNDLDEEDEEEEDLRDD